MSLRQFRADQRGNMGVLFAFGFTISAMVSALAVDGAALYHQRRAMQAAVDLAAISAATDPSRAAEIAQSVLAEARLLAPAGTDGLDVTTGHYEAGNPDIAARFQPHATPVNAVRVALDRPGTLYFAAGFAPPPAIGVAGIAAVEPQVAFSIGSRLASLNAGLANALLSDLLGTSVSLSLMDYSALAAARVDALAFLDALALQMGVTAGTYADLLSMEAPAGALTAALAGLANGAGAGLLQTLAGGTAAVPLGSLFSLGSLADLSLGSGLVSGLTLSALDLLSAAAVLADGDRQVGLNLAAGVPGVVSLSADLSLGEPVQGSGFFVIGSPGVVARTAQTRLRLRAELLGGPVLLGAGLRLPLWLDLAPAEARLVAASCPSAEAPHGSASLAVRPGLVQLAVGEMSDIALRDFGVSPSRDPVRLLDVLLLRVTGSAFLELASPDPVLLDFSSAEIASGTIETARTAGLATALTQSLLDELDLTISILGLGLSSPAIIEQAVRNLLVPLAPTLDLLVQTLLSTLGLGLGEADLRVHDVRCDHPVLVG